MEIVRYLFVRVDIGIMVYFFYSLIEGCYVLLVW